MLATVVDMSWIYAYPARIMCLRRLFIVPLILMEKAGRRMGYDAALEMEPCVLGRLATYNLRDAPYSFVILSNLRRTHSQTGGTMKPIVQSQMKESLGLGPLMLFS